MCPRSTQATVYVTEEQYQRWKGEADDRDMSTSEFISSMVEAGLKKFEVEFERDESYHSLRRQRNEIKNQLGECRERVSDLEEQLHTQERKDIEEFVEANPGTSFDAVLQHIVDSAPRRVNSHLHALEGDAIRVEGEQYYPLSETGGEA